jgi:hypothetical protein
VSFFIASTRQSANAQLLCAWATGHALHTRTTTGPLERRTPGRKSSEPAYCYYLSAIHSSNQGQSMTYFAYASQYPVVLVIPAVSGWIFESASNWLNNVYISGWKTVTSGYFNRVLEVKSSTCSFQIVISWKTSCVSGVPLLRTMGSSLKPARLLETKLRPPALYS